MSRGYQHDPLAEHSALVELAAAEAALEEAYYERNRVIRRWLDREGVRAQVLADHLGISRATLYRLVSTE